MKGKLRVRILIAAWALTTLCVLGSLAIVGSGAFGLATIVVALLAGAVVAFGMSELSVRWFDDAVRPLTDAARRMHEGDLTVRARVAREQDVGQLGAAFEALRELLPGDTQMAFATAISRHDEAVCVTTLAEARSEQADMRTLVLVGTAATRRLLRPGQAPWLYTPRSLI